MVTEKDRKFVDFLLNQTRAGEHCWEVREREDQFLTFFKDDRVVTVGKDEKDGEADFWLNLRDRSGREALRISGDECPSLRELWFYAKREAFGVDDALNEMMGSNEPASVRPKGRHPTAPATDDDIPPF